MVITNKAWVRQALLYWDDIGSIVPEPIWNEHPYFELEDEETNQLNAAKLYRPFFPEKLRRNYGLKLENSFYDEFFVRLDHFRAIRNFDLMKSADPIYELKEMRRGFFDELERRDLATRKLGGKVKVSEFRHPIIYVESNTANIYMSLLAEYLANHDKKITIPTTDRTDCLDLAYLATDIEIKQDCAKVLLNNILPVPSSNVRLDRIIDFRQDHRTDLLKFRKVVDQFEKDIKLLTDTRDVLDKSRQFEEDLEREVRLLNESLTDRRIETIFGSLDMVINSDQPEWWPIIVGSGLVAAGTGAFVLCAIGGFALGAGVQVSKYLAKRHIERNQILRDSPISYVHHLQNLTN
jgi:hypothetical protein